MKFNKSILILFFALTIILSPVKDLFAGSPSGGAFLTFPETDAQNTGDEVGGSSIFYVFDLRDRETFIQLTFSDVVGDETFSEAGFEGATAHVQIYDVSNNCNENDFFDNYTLNDTHVYNMRNIQTNDGNPSGVSLPDGAYGIVAVTMFATIGGEIENSAFPIGNLRIIDNNGYEYRTNAQGAFQNVGFPEDLNSQLYYSFNFNQQGGISLSDIFGITLYGVADPTFAIEWIALPVQGIFSPFDVDIYDLNEVPFSCRDVIFSCVDENNPLLEEVLSIAGTANVASFEYGINNAIPHSKGGELLCPGNIVSEGVNCVKA